LCKVNDDSPVKCFQLSWGAVDDRALALVYRLSDWAFAHKTSVVNAYPVPRGGIYAAQALRGVVSYSEHMVVLKINLVETPEEADVIIDDIIDSGATRGRFDKPFIALVDKTNEPDLRNQFVIFPWERASNEEGPHDNVRRILQYIGEDPDREGLLDTPNRVVKSYAHLFSGYGKNPADVMKVFEDGGENYNEMVLLKNIEFFSNCEHHMQPFFGRAHIAYLPDKRVLGISKLARLLEVFSRRLQIQERLTTQVADALMQYLEPKGAAVVIEAKHFCMVARGVEKQNSIMTTSALRGAFMDSPTVRSEFMSMIRD